MFFFFLIVLKLKEHNQPVCPDIDFPLMKYECWIYYLFLYLFIAIIIPVIYYSGKTSNKDKE